MFLTAFFFLQKFFELWKNVLWKPYVANLPHFGKVCNVWKKNLYVYVNNIFKFPDVKFFFSKINDEDLAKP